MGLRNQWLRRVEREANRLLPAPEAVPLRGGGELQLPPGGRIAAYMAIFEAQESADIESGLSPDSIAAVELEEDTDPRSYVSDPLLLAVLRDEVDYEAAAARDPDLGSMCNLLRCLTVPMRDGSFASEAGEE